MSFINQVESVNRADVGGTPVLKPSDKIVSASANSSSSSTKKPSKRPSASTGGGSSSSVSSSHNTGNIIHLGPTASERAKLASINAYKNRLSHMLAEKQRNLYVQKEFEQQSLRAASESDIRAQGERLALRYNSSRLDSKSAYIKYMQNKRASHQAMAMNGVNGGAKNSNINNLDRRYSSHLDDIWSSFEEQKKETKSRVQQIRAKLQRQLEKSEQRYRDKVYSAQESAYKTMADLERQAISIQGKYW